MNNLKKATFVKDSCDQCKNRPLIESANFDAEALEKGMQECPNTNKLILSAANLNHAKYKLWLMGHRCDSWDGVE